jgi:formate/nitrite transporter FocA (FNT family)
MLQKYRYNVIIQVLTIIYLQMLTKKEEKFLIYWTQKRQESKLNPLFFIKGFTAGILVGLLIFVSVVVGWYKRAAMDASTKLNPVVFMIALIIIAAFLAVFYNSFRYEQNEQAYQELQRKNKLEK